MTKDYSKREVGWVITKDHTVSQNDVYPNATRENWGQLLIHAEETDQSFDRPYRHVVFMDKSLTEHMIPDDMKVRWKSYTDDGDPCYDGLVRADWLFHAEGEDLAYNIDRFNMTDVGAVHVYYSANDIIDVAKKLEEPSWERFAREHTTSANDDLDDPSAWIEIYG